MQCHWLVELQGGVCHHIALLKCACQKSTCFNDDDRTQLDSNSSQAAKVQKQALAARSLVDSSHCRNIAANAAGEIFVPSRAIHVEEGLSPKNTGKPELSGERKNHQNSPVVRQGLGHVIDNLGPWMFGDYNSIQIINWLWLTVVIINIVKPWVISACNCICCEALSHQSTFQTAGGGNSGGGSGGSGIIGRATAEGVGRGAWEGGGPGGGEDSVGCLQGCLNSSKVPALNV